LAGIYAYRYSSTGLGKIMDEKLLKILKNRMEKYPHALEKQYPRVLNKILALWDTPGIDACFAELMVDDRGDRAGFPHEVASEIFYLSTLIGYQSEAGEHDPWKGIPDDVKQEAKLQNIEFTRQGLIKATESGNARVVAVLLNSGLGVDTRDERQWTPLMIAASNGKEELTALLIKSGAGIHHRDAAGYTALHWAAYNGAAKTVELLLNEHADVNACSSNGWTALLQAAMRGHLTVTSILIENGAEVNAASSDGWTPLYKAAANGHLAEVKLLLSKGADASAKCSDGTTALDIARKNKHEQVVAVLSGK
jgi:hypothetical protein